MTDFSQIETVRTYPRRTSTATLLQRAGLSLADAYDQIEGVMTAVYNPPLGAPQNPIDLTCDEDMEEVEEVGEGVRAGTPETEIVDAGDCDSDDDWWAARFAGEEEYEGFAPMSPSYEEDDCVV